MSMKTNNFRSSDFLTITILVLRKHPIVDIDRTNPRRAIFEFHNTLSLTADIQKLEKRKLLVDPFDFWAAERRCKQLIYGGTP